MYLKKGASDFCYFAFFLSYDNLKLKMALLILNLYINRHKMATVQGKKFKTNICARAKKKIIH